MFIADGLVYLELQKTGGSHICRLLKQYAHGRSIGKHNRVTSRDARGYVIGSIRNPWDWYVSLWAYGVSGQGAVRARCVAGMDIDYYFRMLPKSMGKNWLTPGEFFTSFAHDVVKPVHQWRETYKDSFDPVQFRAWLKLLFAQKRRFDIGEGYGFSPLSRHAGLLTYRYFRLYTTGDSLYRDQRLKNFEGIAQYDRASNISSGMIRMESLENDLVRVLEEAGIPLTTEQTDAIRTRGRGKTNVSQRKAAGFYYDEESIQLVAQRERYLIEKYAYEAPQCYSENGG